MDFTGLDFSITQLDCCTKVQFCDITCEHDPVNVGACCDGYGENDNISKRDIAYCRWNIEFPDGSTYTNLDLGWKPGLKSFGSFQVTGGTTGVIVVAIQNQVIGQAIFTSTVAFTVQLLVQSINASSSTTGWVAEIDSNDPTLVVVTSTKQGAEFNGLNVAVSVSGDITVNLITDPTEGGTDDTDCVCINLDDIYNTCNCDPCGCDVESVYPDGVYRWTYILYDSNDVEIARKSNYVLFDCQVKACYRKAILGMGEDLCGCGGKLEERLIKLKMKMEQAHLQLEECLYDCANKTIQSASKMCKNICLDC